MRRGLSCSGSLHRCRRPLNVPSRILPRRHPNLLKGIYAMKFQKPSKIQERALPLLLQNPCVPPPLARAGTPELTLSVTARAAARKT